MVDYPTSCEQCQETCHGTLHEPGQNNLGILLENLDFSEKVN